MRADQNALKWALFLAKAEGRLAKWRLRLAEFDFEVVYRLGVKQSVPDSFYRVEITNGDRGILEDEIPCFVTQDPEAHDWDFADGEAEDLASLYQPVFAIVPNLSVEPILPECRITLFAELPPAQ